MGLPHDKQTLNAEFTRIYIIEDELQHGLSLAQLCRQLGESHGMSRETIEALYAIYRQEQSLPPFANRLLARLRRLSVAPEAIRNVAIIALIGGVIQFVWARFDAHHHFLKEQWTVVES